VEMKENLLWILTKKWTQKKMTKVVVVTLVTGEWVCVSEWRKNENKNGFWDLDGDVVPLTKWSTFFINHCFLNRFFDIFNILNYFLSLLINTPIYQFSLCLDICFLTSLRSVKYYVDGDITQFKWYIVDDQFKIVIIWLIEK
jgi:hypothetical protein